MLQAISDSYLVLVLWVGLRSAVVTWHFSSVIDGSRMSMGLTTASVMVRLPGQLSAVWLSSSLNLGTLKN